MGVPRIPGLVRPQPHLQVSPMAFAQRRSLTSARDKLTAARTYYIDVTNGNDNNDGRAAGSGRAFQTIQKFWDTCLKLDLNGYTVTGQLADGTYTGGLAASGPVLGGDVVLNGNASTPTNVVISKSSGDTISLIAGARLTLQNMRVASGGGNGCIVDGAGSKLTLGVGISLGACTNVGLMAQTNGEVRVGSGITIAGNMTAYYYVQNGGIITSSSTITMSGTPVFSTAGICFDTGGAVTLYGSTSFSGSATGKRYQGMMNALLQSFGAGTASTYFPGNSNGTTATGAQQG